MSDTKKVEMISIPREEMISYFDLMRNANAISEKTNTLYMAILDFLETKGLMQEWQDYYLDHVFKKQKPEGN